MQTKTSVFLVRLLAAMPVILNSWTAAAVDHQPPSRPLNLTLTAKTPTSVTLAWSPAIDEVGVIAYDIFRDGSLSGTSSSNSFVCAGLDTDRAYTFRVQARDEAENVSEVSNALLATPQAGVSQVQPITVRTQFNAFVISYDPDIYADGAYKRAADYYGYRDVDTLVQQYIELMQKASGGQTVWTAAERFTLKEFPQPANKSRPAFTSENYLTLRAQGYDYLGNINPAGPDYLGIIRDPRFGLVKKINAGLIDAIWVFGLPGPGFWETAMVGPTAYYVNGYATIDSALTRNVVFYGFGKEAHQGVGFMCENTCHMAEVIMSRRITPNWPHSNANQVLNTFSLDSPSRALVAAAMNDWLHFVQSDAVAWEPLLAAPGKSQAGLSHIPPTGMYDYNWSTVSIPFNTSHPFRAYDGTWSTANGDYRVLSGNGVKSLAFQGGGSSPMAFSDGDVELTIKLVNSGAASHAGFLFRVFECRTGANQAKGYYVGLNASEDKVILAKLDNAFIPLTNAMHTIDPHAVYRLRIEARGSQLRVYLNGALTPLITVVDDSYITGGFGLTTYGTEAVFSGLDLVVHTWNYSDKWYTYPTNNAPGRYLSPLEWSGDQGIAMDGFYAWWWEHLPKNGGAHYATDLQYDSTALLLNTWWPYVFDINRFDATCPFPDIVFPPEDITPPAAPTGVVCTALSPTRMALSWNEATDNVGVTRYAVYRNGSFLRKTALPYFTDTRLSPNTPYTYLIKACDGSGNVSANGARGTGLTLPGDSPTTVLNGSFEVNPQASDWTSGAFLPSRAQFTWEKAVSGRRGSGCISITATQLNDARWTQTVADLNPGATYWLSGWIKGENIVIEPGRTIGANLCLMDNANPWQHAPDNLAGTFDWRQVSFSFTAPASGVVTIGCRLGYYGNLASGKAWFDDIFIIRPTAAQLDQPHLTGAGAVQFGLMAWPGSRYRIECSADLRSWSQFQMITATHPVTEISPPNTPASPTRFYRAVQLR